MVGKYIVSTVGEMRYLDEEHLQRKLAYKSEANKDFEEIGLDRLYETMVFKARKSDNKCCPFRIIVEEEFDFEGYNTPEEAYKGHLKLCNKWSKK